MKKVVVDKEIHYFFESEKEMRDFAKSIGLKITRYSKEKYRVDNNDSDRFFTAYNTKHINGVLDWCKGNYGLYEHKVGL